MPFCMKCLMMCANEEGFYTVLGHRGPFQAPGKLYSLISGGTQQMKRSKGTVTLLEGKFTAVRVPDISVYLNQLQMYLQEENC